MMSRKIIWIVVIVLAIGVGLYPGLYFIIDRKFGLLSSKTDELLTDTIWNIGFYTHIILGGVAILIGWTQFSKKIRTRNLAFHRKIGKVYVIAALLSALAGIYIAVYATGGIIPSLGFIGLGISWFFTTMMAYLVIRKKQIDKHERMMVYSYAVCFAAVTLRIWLPLFTSLFGSFKTGYSIASWFCWIPNLFVAYLINRRNDSQKLSVVPQQDLS